MTDQKRNSKLYNVMYQHMAGRKQFDYLRIRDITAEGRNLKTLNDYEDLNNVRPNIINATPKVNARLNRSYKTGNYWKK